MSSLGCFCPPEWSQYHSLHRREAGREGSRKDRRGLLPPTQGHRRQGKLLKQQFEIVIWILLVLITLVN